jgi:dienelactone hydrolase
VQTSNSEIRVSGARVIRQPVDREGLVATLFRPLAPGPHPTVIVLSGSLGGMLEGSAAVLASQGFAALALAYFGVDPLPSELVEVPLEYFAEAIAWLKTQPAVDPDRIAVMGVSKGGELAVLLGATYPEDVKAVVGYSPCSPSKGPPPSGSAMDTSGSRRLVAIRRLAVDDHAVLDQLRGHERRPPYGEQSGLF